MRLRLWQNYKRIKKPSGKKKRYRQFADTFFVIMFA